MTSKDDERSGYDQPSRLQAMTGFTAVAGTSRFLLVVTGTARYSASHMQSIAPASLPSIEEDVEQC